MWQKFRSQPDLHLLLSLLVMIVLYPALDHGVIPRTLQVLLLTLTMLQATVRVSQTRHRWWSSAVLLALALCFATMSKILSKPSLAAMQWATLTVFFGFMVSGLFGYLRRARGITDGHLYTAVTTYLLLAMLWFCMYNAVEAVYPGSFKYADQSVVDRRSELLYFSMSTITTLGYGDIVPVAGEVRMLAVLEGAAGVLYVAIAISLLVGAYRRQPDG